MQLHTGSIVAAAASAITKSSHGAHGATGISNNQFRSIRDAVWGCTEIGGSAKLVALRLVEHWPRIFPSLRSLCFFTGLSERTVRDALRELEKVGVIHTHRRLNKKHGGTTTSEYSFPGVSIPALGVSPQTPPPPAEAAGGEGAESAAPPSPNLPPPPRQDLPPPVKQEDLLSSKKKQGRGARERAAPAPAFFSTSRSKQTTAKQTTTSTAKRTKQTKQTLWPNLVGWTPSTELRAEARALGLTDAQLDRRIAKLGNGPIGGRRGGVYDRDGYVRDFLADWAKWEGEKKNPVSSRAEAPSIAFPSKLVHRVGGWVPKQEAVAYAERHGLDILEEFGRFVTSGRPKELGVTATWVIDHGPANCHRAFMQQLQQAAGERRAVA